MVLQISAALPSPDFYSGKCYIKKINVNFLAMCAKFKCKIEKFELEVVGESILWTGFCFQCSR